MSYNELLNRPYFCVPADCPQVRLLMARTKGSVASWGWDFVDAKGRRYCSPGIYFGSLVMWPVEGEPGGGCDERDEARGAGCGDVAHLLGFDECAVVRLDYACFNDDPLLLRAGHVGELPLPYACFDATAISAAEAYIADFLAQPYGDVLMNRRLRDADETLLFAGESEFYEGFLGDEGLPLMASEPDEDGVYTLGDTLVMMPL